MAPYDKRFMGFEEVRDEAGVWEGNKQGDGSSYLPKPKPRSKENEVAVD